MAGRFTVESIFKAVDRVTAPVSRMQNRVGKFTRSMSRGFTSVSKASSAMASGIMRGARRAVVGLALITAAMTSLASAGLDFEQAITDVGAVSLQTREEVKPLEDLAKQLGATTKFTATEAANAMEILARAGFNNTQIMQAVPAVLSAAAASGLEIAEVADHVSNVLKGMGLEMDQAGRVADVLALASARTNSSIGSLGESMRNVASTARQLNVPLESAVASVALLQDVGLDASVAGSAFNVMLTKMAAPSASLQKKMKKLGVSFKDAKGDMLPLDQVLAQLSAASDKVGGNFDKVAFLAELVGLRGQKAAANLADLFKTGRVAELTEELKNAAGAAKKMSDIRMDTTRGSLTLLGSAIDAVKVQMFDMNSGPLKDTIDKMTVWVNVNQDLIATRFTEYLKETVDVLKAIAPHIKSIGIALGVFFAFNAILKILATTLTVVNLLMTMNPLGLMVVGIAAAIAGLVALVTWIDEVIAMFDRMPGVLKLAFAPLRLVLQIIKFIKDTLSDGLTVAVRNFGEGVKSYLGFGGDNEDDQADGTTGASRRAGRNGGAQVETVSPQERVARSLEETRTTSTAEVTIKDETRRAQVTRGRLKHGIKLVPTGAM